MTVTFDKEASDIATCCRLAERFDALDGAAIIARLPGEYSNQHRGDALREKWHLLDRDGLPMPLLADYPEIEEIFDAFPGNVVKAHISRLGAGMSLNVHRDGLRKGDVKQPQFQLFNRTLRIHVVLQSNDTSWIYAERQFYRMRPGECWMLNNLKYHSALNADDAVDRYHVIFDVEPNEDTFALLREADDDLGFEDRGLFERHWPDAKML